MQISQRAMQMLCELVDDVMDRIGREAGNLLRQTRAKTLTARTIKYATMLLLSEEMAKYANAEGLQAVEQ